MNDIAREVSSAFLQFDTDCKGYLTRHELRAAHIAIIGHPPSLVRFARLPIEAMWSPELLLTCVLRGVRCSWSSTPCFRSVRTVGCERPHTFSSGLPPCALTRSPPLTNLTGIEAGIELPQLCELMARRIALQEPDEVIRRAFRSFDEQSKGYISLRDFEGVMSSVAPHLPRETVSLAFSEIDADRDGRVSYKDFHGMMAARPAGAPRVPVADYAGQGRSSRHSHAAAMSF